MRFNIHLYLPGWGLEDCPVTANVEIALPPPPSTGLHLPTREAYDDACREEAVRVAEREGKIRHNRFVEPA